MTVALYKIFKNLEEKLLEGPPPVLIKEIYSISQESPETAGLRMRRWIGRRRGTATKKFDSKILLTGMWSRRRRRGRNSWMALR